jgi:hypothetical protein
MFIQQNEPRERAQTKIFDEKFLVAGDSPWDHKMNGVNFLIPRNTPARVSSGNRTAE